MDSKVQNATQIDETDMLGYGRDLVQLVHYFRYDIHNGADGGFSKNVDILEADPFKQSAYVRNLRAVDGLKD